MHITARMVIPLRHVRFIPIVYYVVQCALYDIRIVFGVLYNLVWFSVAAGNYIFNLIFRPALFHAHVWCVIGSTSATLVNIIYISHMCILVLSR